MNFVFNRKINNLLNFIKIGEILVKNSKEGE